jgi:hypothetical protein
MFHFNLRQNFAALCPAMPSSNRCRTRFTFLLTSGFATTFVFLVFALAVDGQTVSKTVLVIRNVQIANGPENARQNADVMIIEQKIIRLEAGAAIPQDATIIDGGGNLLTINPDGSIRLTQDATTLPQTPLESESIIAPIRNVSAAGAVSFKQLSVEQPDNSSGENLGFSPSESSTSTKVPNQRKTFKPSSSNHRTTLPSKLPTRPHR